MQQQFKASINGNYLTVSDRPATINLMEVTSIENVPPLGTRPPVAWYSEAKMIKFRAWDNATEKFRHTKQGLLTNLYQKLKFRNKKNGFGELEFNLKEFKEWSIKNDNFNRLFNIWEFDDYSKMSKPSVDRINPQKGYAFNNMQWLSWNENYYKGIYEVIKKKEKPVLMYKNGMYVGKFKSVKDVQYFLGVSSNGNISEVLNGNRKHVNGYSLKFGNPELLEADK